MGKEMKTCMLCHSTTSGHRNDLFDGFIKDIEILAGYIISDRYNQAGNVLISTAKKLMETYDGCCAPDENIQKYGDKTSKLIELAQEISKMHGA